MKDTIKIQLESGGEKEIDTALITEYGTYAPCFVVPTRTIWPEYRPGASHCYVKLRPFEEMIFITRESLEEVHKLKEDENEKND